MEGPSEEGAKEVCFLDEEEVEQDDGVDDVVTAI